MVAIVAEIYRERLESESWPKFDEVEFDAYQARIRKLKALVGETVWAGAVYDELRLRLEAEFEAGRNFIVDYGYLPEANAIQMIWVEPGTFNMGSLPSELDRGTDEGPITIVTLTEGFWMSKHEVTQLQWESLMGTSVDVQRTAASAPSLYGVGPQHPMYYISWNEAMSFCEKLTSQERVAGRLREGYE